MSLCLLLCLYQHSYVLVNLHLSEMTERMKPKMIFCFILCLNNKVFLILDFKHIQRSLPIQYKKHLFHKAQLMHKNSFSKLLNFSNRDIFHSNIQQIHLCANSM